MAKDTVISFNLFDGSLNKVTVETAWVSGTVNKLLRTINATKKVQHLEGSMFIVGTKEDQERAADSLKGLQLLHEGEIYKIQVTSDIHAVQIDNFEPLANGDVKAYLVGEDHSVIFKPGQLERLGISLSCGDQSLVASQADSDKVRKTRQCCGKDEQGNRCTKHTLSEYRVSKNAAWIPLCASHQYRILHPGFAPAEE